MEKTQPNANDQSTVGNRWWAEVGKERRQQAEVRSAPAGSRFFRAGTGFQQEVARDRLTDNNLKLLREVNPAEGEWSYVRLAERTVPEAQRNRTQQHIPIPPFVRAVFVDCGRTVRVLATGTPIGERILELTLGGDPSFDCWVRDEWVREQTYRSVDEAMRKFRGLMVEYLAPESIARAESIAPRI